MVAADLNHAARAPRRVAPQVVLADGDEASGLADMLASLLEQNLRDFPTRARVAGRTRGEVVLVAADNDIAVTLRFEGDRVVVTDGSFAGAPRLTGPWLEMARVCSGQLSPLAAARSGALQVAFGRRPLTLAGAGFALSVPAAFYEDADQRRQTRRRRATVTALFVLGAVATIAVVRRRA